MSSSSSNSGIGLFGCTFLVFMVLKLTNKIEWSWWLVTSPLWAPVTLLLVGLAIALLVMIVYDRVKK